MTTNTANLSLVPSPGQAPEQPLGEFAQQAKQIRDKIKAINPVVNNNSQTAPLSVSGTIALASKSQTLNIRVGDKVYHVEAKIHDDIDRTDEVLKAIFTAIIIKGLEKKAVTNQPVNVNIFGDKQAVFTNSTDKTETIINDTEFQPFLGLCANPTLFEPSRYNDLLSDLLKNLERNNQKKNDEFKNPNAVEEPGILERLGNWYSAHGG